VTVPPVTPAGAATLTGTAARADERRAERQARDVARDLEALLVSQMIAAMRRTVPSGGLLQASAARRTLDGAFDHELARALGARGGLGLAGQIEAQLARQPGTAPAAAAFAGVPVPAVSRAPEIAPAPAPRAPAAVVAARDVAHAVAASARAEAHVGAGPARAGSAAFEAPVEGRVSSGFGLRSDPVTGAERFHAGVDLAAPRGTPVRVAADGQVIFSGWRGAGGNVVVVRHDDGLTTSYAHAERLLATAGQNVVAGEVIATVGASGRATGPHLHFSARRDGQPIDPTTLLPELGMGGGHG